MLHNLIFYFCCCYFINATVSQFDVFTSCQCCQTAFFFQILIACFNSASHFIDGSVEIVLRTIKRALRLHQFLHILFWCHSLTSFRRWW